MSSRMRKGLALLAAGIFALGLSGCAQIGDWASTIGPNPFGSTVYDSTAGSDAGTSVTWLATDPLRMSFVRMNGTLTMVLVTPCNAINLPVDVRGDELVPHTEEMSTGAVGCLGKEGAQERWASDFVTRTMQMERTSDTLVLKHGASQIDFQKKDSAAHALSFSPITAPTPIGTPVAEAKPFSDTRYVSTSGTQDGRPVAWVAGTPLTLFFARQDGALVMAVTTPCDGINIEVDVEAGGGDLVPRSDRVGGTQMLCRGERAEQEKWASELITHPMHVTRTDTTLTLESGSRKAEFQVVG